MKKSDLMYITLILFFLLSANDSDYFDRSAEISEIDERLNRLQEFMKTTLGQ